MTPRSSIARLADDAPVADPDSWVVREPPAVTYIDTTPAMRAAHRAIEAEAKATAHAVAEIHARISALGRKEDTVRKTILSAVIAIAATTPSYAWRAITLRANTDPDEILAVIFTAPKIPAVKFTLDMPGTPGWFRVFGPLPETGPCLRTLTVVVTNPYLGWTTVAAKTPMNVCTESNIFVSGAWTGMSGQAGGSELVVTHGF